MNKLYILNGQVSELQCYWEAYHDGSVISQVDSSGKVCMKKTDLPQNIDYFGIVCPQGRFGFYLNDSKLRINDQNITILNRKTEDDQEKIAKLTGDLYFRRRIVGVLGGDEETQLVEIGVGTQRLIVRFKPVFEITYTPIYDKSDSQQGMFDT